MKKSLSSIILFSVTFILLIVNSEKIYSQNCIHTISTTYVYIPKTESGTVIFFDADSYCKESLYAYSNDSWISVYMDTYEEMLCISVATSEGLERQGTVIIDDYDDIIINVNQEACAAPPAPEIINGDNFACLNSTKKYSIAPIEGVDYYYWYVSTGGSVVGENGKTSADVNFSAGPNATIYVYGNNFCGSGPAASLTVSKLYPPSITTHPSSKSVCSGNPATFSVGASGAGTLYYQWQYSTNGGGSWNSIAGATGSSYETGTNDSMNGYIYRCQVSNSCGSVYSNGANLSFISKPTSNMYGNIESCGYMEGGTISISFSGSAPWNFTYTDGTTSKQVSGISSQPYSLPVASSETKTYRITSLSDKNCTATSSGMTGTATLTVKPVPAIPSVNTSQVYCGTKIFSELNGTPASGCNIEWYNVSVGGDPIYMSSPVNSGTYFVQSSNPTTLCNSSRVEVSVQMKPIPPDPNPIVGASNFCGDQTISSSSNVGGELYWFNDRNEMLGQGNSFTVSNSGRYLVKTYIEYDDCWSTGSVFKDVVINPIPESPANPTVSTNTCGDKTISRGAPPANVTWYWQGTSGAGASTSLGSEPTFTVSSSNIYYIRAKSYAGCWSSSSGSVAVTVNQLPSSPSVNTSQSFCGSAAIANLSAAPPSGSIIEWFNVSSGGSALSGGTGLSSGTYFVQSKNSATSCESSRTAVNVTINPLPTTYSVTGTGSYCSGSSGLPVGLNGSQSGVNYQLYNGATPIGGLVSGSGAAISFGNKTTAASYTVRATNASTSCTAMMNGDATISINPLPAIYNVNGGGSYCSGSSGLPVGLSGSQSGVNYQLYNGSTPVGSTIAGSGYDIGFDNQTTAATYTVRATNASTSCTAMMNGDATISINSLPAVYSVNGGGGYCSGSSGLPVGLNSSQWGVNYQLYNGTTPIGDPVTGSGTAIGFGNLTTAATYTVKATNSSTYCTSMMSGGATISINPLPAVYSVNGGGSYCSGSSGIAVGLSGSQSGVNYLLYIGGSTFASPLSGTGSALSFGNQTAAASYTVKAINATTGCTAMMGESATVTITQLPTITGNPSNQTVCDGTSASFSSGANGPGISTQWQYSSNGGNTWDNTGISVSNYSFPASVSKNGYLYRYHASNTCGVAYSNTALLTVNTVPAIPVAFNGEDLVCEYSTTTFQTNPVNGVNYHWAASDGTITEGLGTSEITYRPGTNSSATISLAFSNVCGSSATISKTITVQTPPTSFSGEISGYPQACKNGNGSFSVTEVEGATSYYWSVDDGLIFNGQGTNSSEIKFNTGNYATISVYYSNACGSSPAISRSISLVNTPQVSILANKPVVGTNSNLCLWVEVNNGGLSPHYQWKINGVEVVDTTNIFYYNKWTNGDQVSCFVNNEGCSAESFYTVYAAPIFDQNDKNFFIENNILKPNVKTQQSVYDLTSNDLNKKITYFDGLGRPLQSINWQSSPDKKDVIQPFAYDEYGRETIKYLPYIDDAGTGIFRSNALAEPYTSSDHFKFYTNGYNNNPDAADDLLNIKSTYTGDLGENLDVNSPVSVRLLSNFTTNGYDFTVKITPITDPAQAALVDRVKPYSVTVFEPSPLNRVMEKGAPGIDWQPTNQTGKSDGHTQKMVYTTNSASTISLWKVNNTTGLLTRASGDAGYYTAGTLFVTIVKNENWKEADGIANTTTEYKDIAGRTIMKTSYAAEDDEISTYYVYDDMGRLRYVLSPEAYAGLGTATSVSSDVINSLCFSYTYDERGRIIEKRLPGVEPIFMVYDKRNRLVLSQDGNMRNSKNPDNSAKNQWSFTKYDELNRPILTGTVNYPSTSTRATLQASVNGNSVYGESRTASTIGYTLTNTYPVLNATATYEILNITYYDDYDFDNNGNPDKQFAVISNYTAQPFNRLTGNVTGTKTNVLGATGVYLTSVSFYDKYNRTIQGSSDNYLSGSDRVTTEYAFSGEVSKTIHQQYINGGTAPSITTEERFIYDNGRRLKDSYHKVYEGTTGGTEVKTSQLDYNELGQLVTKNMHVTGASVAQKVDYTYNIRGWLKTINNPNDLSAENDAFAMQLMYNDVTALNGVGNPTPQFNGNISGAIWRNRQNSTTVKDPRAYTYSYDALSRINEGIYLIKTTEWAKPEGDFYSEKGITYDKNGNIEKLTRYGETGILDNLTYTYSSGNKLSNIEDAVTTLGGFKDKDNTNSVAEYAYDYNGNLTRDDNKEITAIEYNLLNLPKKITFGANQFIEYIYTASGQKLAKKVTNGSAINWRYYIGGVEYTGNGTSSTFVQLNFSEGLITKPSTNFSYEYFVKDHLGNTRAVVQSNGEVLQGSNYYPFGLQHFLVNPDNDNKYLYNGKELQSKEFGSLGLDWYDYGARFYDPQVGRFNGMDPISENYSFITPYNYAENCPISNIDLWGLQKFPALKPMSSCSDCHNPNGAYRWLFTELTIVPKEFRGEVFKLYFNNTAGKYIDMYVNNVFPGSFFKMSEQDMKDVHPKKIGLLQKYNDDPSIHERFVNTMSKLKVGESADVENWRYFSWAHTTGTLGQFSVFFNGKITKTGKGEYDWKFDGTMKFKDTYNFDPKASGERSTLGEFQTETAWRYLLGNYYNIESPEIKVSQSGHQQFIDWFNNVPDYSISNPENREESALFN